MFGNTEERTDPSKQGDLAAGSTKIADYLTIDDAPPTSAPTNSIDPEPVRQDGFGPTGTTGNDSTLDDTTRTFSAIEDDRATTTLPAATGSAVAATATTTVGDAPAGTEDGLRIPRAAGLVLGVVRILVGWQFLWAFLDKTFGLGYGTPSERSWLNGGDPSAGFLGGVANDPNNPFAGLFGFLLEQPWTSAAFMITLLFTGVVLMVGPSRLLTAIGCLTGAGLMATLYLAVWPIGHSASAVGPEGSASPNPIYDMHVLSIVVLALLALTNAGAYLGFAKATTKDNS